MNPLRLHNLIRRIASDPWMLSPSAYGALLVALDKIDLRSLRIDDANQAADPFARLCPKEIGYEVQDGVAVIPVCGVLSKNTDGISRLFFGELETDEVVSAIERAAADPKVQATVLDVNSPGGLACGMPEASARVREAAKSKPIVAHTSDLMASAAYYLASQCTEIMATKSGNVGSIGTIVSFIDYSGAFARAGLKQEVFTDGSPYKAMGMPGTALTPEQRDEIQQRVDIIGRDFRQDVKAARPFLRESAMRGQVYLGQQAVEIGMIDRIGSLENAKMIAKQRSSGRGK
jgi:signal peptide peptidase SppA